jgi:hypothetical protein
MILWFFDLVPCQILCYPFQQVKLTGDQRYGKPFIAGSPHSGCGKSPRFRGLVCGALTPPICEALTPPVCGALPRRPENKFFKLTKKLVS